MKKDIGIRISNLRKSMNMNKKQFAKLIGISGQYLGTVESGVNCLSLHSLINLCKNTNVSADYIFFGKKNFIDKTLKKLFFDMNEVQINSAFKILENIALFIKNS